jgi:hypothetical protein
MRFISEGLKPAKTVVSKTRIMFVSPWESHVVLLKWLTQLLLADCDTYLVLSQFAWGSCEKLMNYTLGERRILRGVCSLFHFCVVQSVCGGLRKGKYFEEQFN